MKELESLLEKAGRATQGSRRAHGDSDGRPVVTAGDGRGIAYTWLVDDAEFFAACSPAVVKALVETVQAAEWLQRYCRDFRSAESYVSDFDAALSRLADALKGAG